MTIFSLGSRFILDQARLLTTGLSGRLLRLTILFVLLAESLVFIPSLANLRLTWLEDRVVSATRVGLVIDGVQNEVPAEIQKLTLHSLGVELIAIRKDDTSRLVAAVPNLLPIDGQVDLSEVTEWGSIKDAVKLLLNPSPQTLRVIDDIDESRARIEIVVNTKDLREAMLQYLTYMTVIALIISAIIGALTFGTLNRLFVTPIRRLIDGMQHFSEQPDDPSRIYKPSSGKDEMAQASNHLFQMQLKLHYALKQQRNLAELGMAVSKINHDMRNILSSAQLMSDSLTDVSDPFVKSFAPRLIRTLDRAVRYTEELISFGQAKDVTPKRQQIKLFPILNEVREVILFGVQKPVDIVVYAPEDLSVFADSEQIFRVLYNLLRNAVQAIETEHFEEYDRRRVTITAEQNRDTTEIIVDDDGPGMHQKAKENLFSAFKGSVRAGGTGLGLVIARELVLAHGGKIALVEKSTRGTQFRIELPSKENH